MIIIYQYDWMVPCLWELILTFKFIKIDSVKSSLFEYLINVLLHIAIDNQVWTSQGVK